MADCIVVVIDDVTVLASVVVDVRRRFVIFAFDATSVVVFGVVVTTLVVNAVVALVVFGVVASLSPLLLLVGNDSVRLSVTCVTSSASTIGSCTAK